MAHCSSSLVRPPSFSANKSGHNEKPQDLLPPRKRHLAGLKHVKDTPASTSCAPPPPTESLRIEMHIDASPTSSAPPHSLLLRSPSHKCFSCGDGGILLHRVPCLAGSSSYHCSSCVLAINKNMYCVLCYQVIEDGLFSSSSPGLLTCCRCQRLTHLDCALEIWSSSLEGVGLTLCRDCYTRNNGQFKEAPINKQKTGSAWRSNEAAVSASKFQLPLVDIQEVAAARIVAITAKRAALEAKQRAEVLAKAAACAAMHAKMALDNVYKLSPKKTDVKGHADGVVCVANKDEGGIAAPKNPKSLKRRALSAIVASEMLSKRADTTVNCMSSTDFPESKRLRAGLDSGCAEATSSQKQRKALSSLGSQYPPTTRRRAVRKGSKSKLAKRGLSKGKLGAIVSQVLASKRSGKAPPCKAILRPQCAILDDAAENGVGRSPCNMHAKSGSMVTGCLPILRGTIAGTDACKTSHQGIFI